MQMDVGGQAPGVERNAGARNAMTLGDVAMFSGAELAVRFGPSTAQQLVDLIVIAIRRGDDDEVAAIDGRLQEVEALSQR